MLASLYSKSYFEWDIPKADKQELNSDTFRQPLLLSKIHHFSTFCTHKFFRPPFKMHVHTCVMDTYYLSRWNGKLGNGGTLSVADALCLFLFYCYIIRTMCKCSSNMTILAHTCKSYHHS